jgi:hypothetical protein
MNATASAVPAAAKMTWHAKALSFCIFCNRSSPSNALAISFVQPLTAAAGGYHHSLGSLGINVRFVKKVAEKNLLGFRTAT